jgi:hypothetical protein
MQFHCAQCHHAWGVEGDEPAHKCPNCGAEAGLEPARKIPAPMRYFALLLGAVILSAISGGLIGRFAG